MALRLILVPFLYVMTEKEINKFIKKNKLTEYNFINRFYSENLDLSLIKSDVDVEKFISLVEIVIGEIGKKHFDAMKFHLMESNKEEMIKEMGVYGNFIKLGYYK